MPKSNIAVVLGNRPQFIKHAALHRAWEPYADEVRQFVIDTGQHYDYELAGVFMDELALPTPDFSLGVGSASHAEQLARMLPALEEIFRTEKPASVVVYGDTNSTLGAALAASKLQIPVAHIEAGLRSFDRAMPEEINRVLTDAVSSTLFCPTQTAVDNLATEGITRGVHMVGDVMADIALALVPAAEQRWGQWVDRGIEDGTYGLVTVHRASNTEPAALEALIDGFARVDIPLVFPIHPRTQAALERSGLHVRLADLEHVTMLPPVSYLDLAALTRHALMVLTDSGGLQKEAFVHGTPCVTLRNTTEWVETLSDGRNVLVHTDTEQLVNEVTRVRERASAGGWSDPPPVYGSGDAAERIVRTLVSEAAGRASLLAH